MKAGLVGYAQTGKTTLFNALTGQSVQTGGGSKGKSNLGVIKVPDERLDRLTAIYRPRRTVPAEVVFVDVPGPRTKGGGLDGSTIQAVQEADALAVVLRAFDGADGSPPQPLKELRDFESELILADLGVVERRLERLNKERGGERQKAVLERCHEALNAERSLRMLELLPEEEREITSFAFLSRRPLLGVLNTREADIARGVPPELARSARERQIEVVDVCAAVEAEIASLAPEEQSEFLASLGIREPASARFIRAAYALLEYISFFTVGEDEVRAWTVRRGSKAPKAAGRVHSDMERGFIRAEVMSYDEFILVASEAKMKETGKLRIEGKEYVVQDGDILNFRFAV
jgi:GTP-binding protein YchF